MDFRPVTRGIGAAVLMLLLLALWPSTAAGDSAIGPRAGYDFDSDEFVLGAEAEFGRVFQVFKLAPSVDFEFADNTVTALNADFRLYLFNLPETGLRFYGSAGPTVMLNAPDKGDTQTEIGLSLVAGMRIPMKRQNRYNLEVRFGVGDIPEAKVMFAVLFGV